MRNFFSLYRPLATTWEMVDNSGGRIVRMIASGRDIVTEQVGDPDTWLQLQEEYGHGK